MCAKPEESSTAMEITPAMMEAGLEAYALFELLDPGEWVVPAIYQAMVKARSSQKVSCPRCSDNGTVIQKAL